MKAFGSVAWGSRTDKKNATGSKIAASGTPWRATARPAGPSVASST